MESNDTLNLPAFTVEGKLAFASGDVALALKLPRLYVYDWAEHATKLKTVTGNPLAIFQDDELCVGRFWITPVGVNKLIEDMHHGR